MVGSDSKIFRTSIYHTRLKPIRHEFIYPAVFYSLDLTNPPRSNWLFSWNRFGLLSFKESDYLKRSPEPLLKQVRDQLCLEGLEEFGHKVILVTNLRLLNYVFNPVSFYFCYSNQGQLGALLAEVNNTFGEKHLYVTKAESNGKGYNSEIAKNFHVSPFCDLKGDYNFRFKNLDQGLDVAIDLAKEGGLEICTRVSQKSSKSFSPYNLLITLLQQPLDGFLTYPRILWQAFLLYYRRKLSIHSKPIPHSKMTLRKRQPSLLEKFAKNRVLSLLSRIQKGRIKLILPEGEEQVFGQSGSCEEGVLNINSYAAFVKILQSGDIGFGDSYVSGYWDSPDLGAVLRVLTMNLDVVDDRALVWTWIGRVGNIIRHFSRINSVRNSKSNIQRHYDLSNRLFGSFLDKSMTYSCAIFRDEKNTLEQAQEEKIRELISKAELKPSDRVLEIGCGWGSFAISAATEIGCHVTAITLSQEQKSYVESRVRELGVENLIEVQLLDYRQLTGSYDKIVSIEMIEAVGHKYLGTFFNICDKLLKPGGKIVIQAITVPDQRYTWYRFGCDWIQRRIFPGGLCPSLFALRTAITKNSTFVVNRVENFGSHYARTLREWRFRFLNSFDDLKSAGFDEEFKRIWTYYLTYCEEGFSCNALDTLHLVLERPSEKSL